MLSVCAGICDRGRTEEQRGVLLFADPEEDRCCSSFVEDSASRRSISSLFATKKIRKGINPSFTARGKFRSREEQGGYVLFLRDDGVIEQDVRSDVFDNAIESTNVERNVKMMMKKDSK